METTIKVEVKGIYSGYEYKDSPFYRNEFGYFTRVYFNGKLVTYEWAKTYKELRDIIADKYFIQLPEKITAGVNYGAPHTIHDSAL